MEQLFTIDTSGKTVREWTEGEKCNVVSKTELIKALKSAKEVRVDKDTDNIDWYVWIR